MLYYVLSSYGIILVDDTIVLQINVSQNHQLSRKDLSALVFSQVQVIFFLLPYTWDTVAQGQSEKTDESKQKNQERSVFRLSATILNRQLRIEGTTSYVSSFITCVLNLPRTYSPEGLKHSIKKIKFDISNSYEYQRTLSGKAGGRRKEEREGKRKGGKGRERSFLEQNAS